ncbi:hypothetical protein HID58_086356 [Brassica napus]|uniref:Uncharacterized protein n=1 Tax=Brassica napus TaxID=3708 RepID=A0ABQ7XQ42_BRANA|nr:hypothetical protein HID58_086356 [Brassica napus]
MGVTPDHINYFSLIKTTRKRYRCIQLLSLTNFLTPSTHAKHDSPFPLSYVNSMFLDAFREMGEVVSVRFCRDMALGDRINLSISPVSKMGLEDREEQKVLSFFPVIRLCFDAEAGNEFTTLLCLRFGERLVD